MPIQVVHAEDGGFNPEEVKMMVYGDSGGGKTWFGATWEDAVIVAADHGIGAIRWPFNYIMVHDWDELVEVYVYLSNGDHPYKTVVLDTLNEMQKLASYHVLDKFPKINRPYDSIMGESDYGKMLWDFEKMYRAYLDLPMNVVFTAQSQPKTFTTDVVRPELTGKKTVRTLERLMDVIGYVYVSNAEKKEHTMLFTSKEYLTKDRSSVLPVSMVNATHAALKRLWQDRSIQAPELISVVTEFNGFAE